MKFGKYVTNLGLLSALFGAFSVSKQTQKMPKDWRRYIVWLVWALGIVLTVASISMQPDDSEDDEIKKLPLD